VAVSLDDEFPGTERFTIHRQLGAGAMGVVYEAFDKERGTRVALKTLRHLDAAAIYRLKREFRNLADVLHPNLVVLHELFSEGQRWFFTMELAEGVEFLSYVRPGTEAHRPPSAPTWIQNRSHIPELVRQRERSAPLDVERLRSALAQLAEGVFALHDAGRLHRDIKPSNVLVTHGGRTVLLDFGLATELAPSEGHLSSAQMIVGTAAYMAPEQAAAQPCTPASDWYSVGAMLYESLTGRVPFAGSHLQILMDKQTVEPPAPRTPAGAEDLGELCCALLRIRPEDRPTGAEVLQALGIHRSRKAASRDPSLSSVASVGQEHPLAALGDALHATRQGHPVTVFVHGAAGAGKTTLASRFAESLLRNGEAVVLFGQCYERESVPFKSLDSLVDALARFLIKLPRHEADALMPREVHTLGRMFPVLRRVEAVAGAPRRGADVPDPQELRERATAAFRELLGRLADRRPVVLLIDSIQWGDADSAEVLSRILRRPDPPALMLVACHRTGDEGTSPTLHDLRTSLEAVCEVRQVELSSLTAEQARTLALNLLERAGLSPKHADAVAQESRGNPLLIHELVRSLQLPRPPSDDGSSREVTLEGMVSARLAQLPPEARLLVEVVAVSGQSLPVSVIERAAGLTDARSRWLGLLRAAHLLRTAAESERVESYHDRIRETILSGLTRERIQELHLRLADALEAGERMHRSAEALAYHLAAAGQPERAAEHAAVAAHQAAQAVAFDRAAALYELALRLRPPDASWGRDLHARWGDALANAGRGPAAADVYLRAAEGPAISAAEALELQRRAAEQLLLSGHIDRGLEVLRRVLGRLGMSFEEGPRRALLSVLGQRALLRLRGLRFRERDTSQVSAEALSRIDVCWSGATGLAMVDVIQGAAFQARHLRLALRAGEPTRIAAGVAVEACFVATAGGRAARRAERLVAAAQSMARRLNQPHVLGHATLAAGITEFLGGRWRRASELTEQAVRVFRDRCTGVGWMISTAQLFSAWSLFYLGEFAELRRNVPEHVREARARGDLYGAACITGLANVAHLVVDDVEGARREVQEVMDQWSQRGFHFQHYWSLLARGSTDLYAGAGPEAWERVRAQWPALERSLLLRIQSVRIEATHLRARSALAAIGRGLDDELLTREAERAARRLERERVRRADALAMLIRSGIAQARGQPTVAAELLGRASEQFDGLEMRLFAAAARRRLGLVLGSTEGAALVSEADVVMEEQGIARPERMMAMLTPSGGCGDPGPTAGPDLP
jgi:eukaryotic-like serine/threonine-protein kinase